MSKITETQMKIAELLQANEAAMTLVERMQEQNAALAAQVEALRDTCSYWINHAKPSGDCSKSEYNTWLALGYQSSAMTKPPKQHLAEIRAEAGRAGFVACHELDKIVPVNDESVQVLADRYADQIRQHGATSTATPPERIIDPGHCHACADKVYPDDYYSKIDGKLYHDGCISESAKHKGGAE